MELVAERVSFDPCDGELLAGAEFCATRQDRQYLAICRSLNPADRGRRRGYVYVELNDQGFSTGGMARSVLKCELSKDALRLLCTDKALEQLRLAHGEEIVIRLHLPADQLSGLNDTLKAIFGDATTADHGSYRFIEDV